MKKNKNKHKQGKYIVFFLIASSMMLFFVFALVVANIYFHKSDAISRQRIHLKNITSATNYLTCLKWQKNSFDFCENGYDKYKKLIGEKLYEQEKNACFYSVQMQNAFLAKNITMCDEIKNMKGYLDQDDRYVEICYLLILENASDCKLMEKPGTKEYYDCVKYLSKQESNFCLAKPNLCIQIQAMKEHKPQLCLQLNFTEENNLLELKTKKCQILAGAKESKNKDFCNPLLELK